VLRVLILGVIPCIPVLGTNFSQEYEAFEVRMAEMKVLRRQFKRRRLQLMKSKRGINASTRNTGKEEDGRTANIVTSPLQNKAASDVIVELTAVLSKPKEAVLRESLIPQKVMTALNPNIQKSLLLDPQNCSQSELATHYTELRSAYEQLVVAMNSVRQAAVFSGDV
jgi:hypothetical protein